MKFRSLSVAIAVLAVVPIAAVLRQASAPAGTFTLSVIGTNDLHGGVLPRGDGRGGLALFSSYVKNLRAARQKDGGRVLLIDAGDLFQGTLESNLNEGAAVMSAYNALGYDASAIGNHEFDYGPVGEAATPTKPGDDPRGALKARMAEAKFPFLAANLLYARTKKPVDWPNVRGYTIVDVNGSKVAIIGLVTAVTLATTIANNVSDLEVAPLASTIESNAAAARKAGATVVIVTAHAGSVCSDWRNPDDLSSCALDEEIMQVARALPPASIDLIVAGHRHETIAHLVNGIPIVESRNSGRAFGRVDLTISRANNRAVSKRIFPVHEICAREDEQDRNCDPALTKGRTLVPATYEGAPIAPDPAIEKLLAPAVEAVKTLKEEKLGPILETPIRRSYEAESEEGNLFADMMLAARPEATLATTNGGSLRANFPIGPITYGLLYEAQPFDNRFAFVRMTGDDLRLMVLENLESNDGILSFSGVRITAICGRHGLDVSMFRPNGKPIRGNDSLVVAMNDFMVTGVQQLLGNRLAADAVVIDNGPPIREAIAAELRKHPGPMRAQAFFDPQHPRIAYSGGRPVKCER